MSKCDEKTEAMLLGLAWGLALAEHVGDVGEDLDRAFELAGLDKPARDDGTGEIDLEAIKARGGKSLWELDRAVDAPL